MSTADSRPARPKTAIILCQVLELEIEHFAAGMDHVVLIEKLQQGLHNEPAKLRQQVQLNIQRIERETEAEAIVLGYGLCSRGTEKLRCQRCTLVVPRAHDCITLLLGDKQRYADYVAKHPGTYWYSPGWNKYHLPPGPGRAEAMYREYCEKYGEDNARFLMESEQQWHRNYERATYVDVGGIGRTEAQKFINAYFARYPQVRAFIDECIAKARDTGYAVTAAEVQRQIGDVTSLVSPVDTQGCVAG